MRALYLFPLWLIGVFTWSKSYRNNPIIGSVLLNRLGLHVFRVVVSHALFRFRLLLLSPLVSAADRRQFLRQGFIVKENFLPPEQFAALNEEVRGYRGDIRRIVEGDTLTDRVFLTHDVRAALPECERLTRHKTLDRLLRYTSSKNRPPFFHVEKLTQHDGDHSGHDPQKDYHVDTFHPCVKAWLFLDEVSDNNGPFMYVPGSHRLSWKRLKWEYRDSIRAAEVKNTPAGGHYWDGSSRVSREDMLAMGCERPQAMTVPANSLVLANVYGIHCRGDAAEPSSRMAIWMQARDNPFNPLFTPFPHATARLFEWVWDSFQKRRDRAQIAKGAQPCHPGGFRSEPPAA